MNAPVMVELNGETDPLEVRCASWVYDRAAHGCMCVCVIYMHVFKHHGGGKRIQHHVLPVHHILPFELFDFINPPLRSR